VVRLILLAVAAAWAGVIIPPLLRSRVDNRPTSSVDDFRRQLSTLQRTVPTRGVSPMRSMARPLSQAPTPSRVHHTTLRADTLDRAHTHGLERRPQPGHHAGHRQMHVPRVSQRELVRRRRANVLVGLIVANAITLFLAATTASDAMIYAFVVCAVALFGYCAKLVQMRNQQAGPSYDTWFNAA
jgi:hypothetical protein